MSTFEVKTRVIDVLDTHPTADRLELVVIGGYKAVVQKGIHKVGDRILYIPEDAVFTNMEIAHRLKIDTYLTGKAKNRVKAIRLRGILSQGIVIPFDIVDEVTSSLGFGYFSKVYDSDLTEPLQIEKYEEPIPMEMAGKVRRWPEFVPKYDVENIKRPESLNVMILGEEVVATEKLHGTNITIAIGPGLDEGEVAFVCSRNNALQESDTNVYWRAVKKYDLVRKVKELLINDPHANETSISLHGEVVGVQDLKYGFINGEIGFFAFDIMIGGKFIDHDAFMGICHHFDIPTVPEIYRGPYDYETINRFAQGKTTLGTGDILEGIVAKPVKERTDSYGNRAQFKFISEEYLLRKGGSELH
jgi:RNA ligase (TIGR02306 family)